MCVDIMRHNYYHTWHEDFSTCVLYVHIPYPHNVSYRYEIAGIDDVNIHGNMLFNEVPTTKWFLLHYNPVSIGGNHFILLEILCV